MSAQLALWQKTLRWAAAAALLAIGLLVLAGVGRVMRVDALAIRWVEVNGAFQRVSAEQVRSAAALHLVDGFFAVDPLRVKAAVEQVPWVQNAMVVKRWPDTVVIDVTEHRPLARWGGDRLVSDTGHLFSVDGTALMGGLPVLNGPDEAAPEVVVFYRALQDRLAGTGLEVARLERSPRGAWHAELAGGVELMLGSDQPLPRVERFVAALRELGGDPKTLLRRVDLRYGHGFAVRWRESAEPGLSVVGME
ncbi:MAG: FtsQ-type POTRA domain-containing protein [Xanthomonadales bacterium]|nr:FtsQ-type POTRA domain-containing protein [Xanthomonadales bacterium]